MPFEYVADDEVVPVVDYGAKEGDSGEGEVDYGPLVEAAISAQRLSVSRAARAHVKGSMEVAFFDGSRRGTPQKMFRVNRMIEWNEGDPVVVVDALAQGRLRCRLSARMGLGKSTRLAPFISKALDYRVLYVSLDAHALQQVGIYIHDSGIGKFTSRWSNERRSMVSCMTYADFNGYMATSRRAELFKAFDVLIFDESIVDSDDVFVAKSCFAVYAPAETNLILCSATIKTDRSGDDGGAANLGNFRQIDRHITVREAIESGKLFDTYLVDRTIVLAPDNQAIYELHEAYGSIGIDSKIIDDAGNYEAIRIAEKWLEGDSTTPRILVAHHSYGIAFNFPIGFVITFGYSVVQAIENDRVVDRVVHMTEDMISQGKSRSGRGIVQGSGGIIMTPERADPVELAEHCKMRAFVKLCAASIMPIRSPFWAAAYDLFPEGLSPNMAHTLLKICLPIEIAIRYFANDGRVASKYCSALTVFSQPDHFLLPSDKEMPMAMEYWTKEQLVCMDGKHIEEVTVPMSANGELQIIMHAIELMVVNRIRVPRWRPVRQFAMNEGYDSEEEDKDPRYKKRPEIKLRRIEDAPIRAIEGPSAMQAIPWAYRPLEGSQGLRRGGYIDSERCREALLAMEASLLDYSMPQNVVTEVIETSVGSMTPINMGNGNVESPGGSVVCSLPVGLCEKLNMGTILSPSEMIKLVFAAREDVDRFVSSKLFDCLSGPWDSILRSLVNRDVLNEIVLKGMASDTFLIVDRMRGRFSIELCSVLASSFIFKKVYGGIFNSTPSFDKVMRAIRKGKFDAVAQTNGFISRVKLVKEMIDQALLNAETSGVYLPTYITNAQRSIPLRGNETLGYDGSTLQQMPSNWAKRLNPKAIGPVIERRVLNDKKAW